LLVVLLIPVSELAMCGSSALAEQLHGEAEVPGACGQFSKDFRLGPQEQGKPHPQAGPSKGDCFPPGRARSCG
jgi:hypothetical protein